jgi:hypothetical protein
MVEVRIRDFAERDDIRTGFEERIEPDFHFW